MDHPGGSRYIQGGTPQSAIFICYVLFHFFGSIPEAPAAEGLCALLVHSLAG
ncbi:hypothetical protein PFLCHA0_c51950 [Pseudomonas protegens CHA0]|uniref:Uncharacterized protein n=1 Tax=Pseudomonas protegens (strain DSM 19095 / LMG 27888 / CFBP 6595 / CHA0) TaxID=1124983 RepID=A0A2C9ETE8_PSEPH|nr:hypothetical protein PFLCHA0_c51950 [Pseudomonas protegens CHA0]